MIDGSNPARELSVKKTLFTLGLLVSTLGIAQAQKINAAGASFPAPIYTKWFTEYSSAHPGVQVNYASIGSGGGIAQVTKGLVDFGASDMPMTDDMLASSPVKLIHIPTVLGAVVPVFNVPGVTDLHFSSDVLADIYLGKISNWNDARIAKDLTATGITPPIVAGNRVQLVPYNQFSWWNKYQFNPTWAAALGVSSWRMSTGMARLTLSPPRVTPSACCSETDTDPSRQRPARRSPPGKGPGVWLWQT